MSSRSTGCRLPRLWLLGLLPLATLAAAAGPPGLSELYADALRDNPGYRARAAEARGVRAALSAAEGRLRPQLALTAASEQVDERIEGTFYGVVEVDNRDRFDAHRFGATLSQALFRPELGIEADQARLRAEQAALSLREAEDALLTGLTAAYFATLAAADDRLLTQAELAAVARQREQIEGRYAAGLATEADLQGARAREALVEAEGLRTRAQLNTRLAALRLVVGRPVTRLRRLGAALPLRAPDPPRLEAWVARARSQNPAVQLRRLGLRLSDQERDKASQRRLPRLDLVGRGLLLDSGGGLSGERRETEGRIGLQLQLPLYTGGQLEAGIEAAEAGREAAAALLAQAEADAERDAQVAFLDLEVGRARLPALQVAVEAARAAESAVRGGFEAGTRTSAEVLEAVETRFAAERDLAGARYRLLLDTLALKRAAGELLVADLRALEGLLAEEAVLP